MQSLFWQASVGSLIAATRRRIKQEAWRRLRSYRITPPQFGVLLILQHEEDLSLSTLAEHMGIDAPTSCRIVSNLVKRKLIRTEHDAEDRRRFHIKLTSAGAKLAKELYDLKAQIEEEILRGLSADERAALVSGLKKIIANVDRMSGQAIEGKSRVGTKRAGGKGR
jgi:DNA-binding MarR family transcriptional regulator